MASTYKTPGVYVEEISTFPASVAQVETAIPAFIGYTEKADDEGEDLTLKPTRIGSLLEYQELFGGSQKVEYQATVELDGDVKIDTVKPLSYLLFHHLEMFFNNGGGDCYIVSIGGYNAEGTISKGDFDEGLKELAKEDEPTIILLTDAINLTSINEYYALAQNSVAQCANLQDRFAVLDIHGEPGDDTVLAFRNGMGTQDLKYGAGYYPNLKTILKKRIDESTLTVEGVGDANSAEFDYTIPGAIEVIFTIPTPIETVPDPTPEDPSRTVDKVYSPKIKINVGTVAGDKKADFTVERTNELDQLTITVEKGTTGKEVVTDWAGFTEKGTFLINELGEGDSVVRKLDTTLVASDVTLATLKTSRTSLYNKIKKELDKDTVVIPPSGAIAGIYAAVDGDRGVWKAPANVSLNGVIKPTLKIDDKDQESLNVDVNGGKSINAIRSFVGKGTLVWGARTLAGNDNEWRYVPVRRFFNMVEESVKKSTHWAVFEPNDANTWIKVKSMIENFLTGLWRDGALAGSSPDQAYFVNVGLGTTMTAQDILEGRMIIEIGMAAVRPAEFIVLRFSHKLQEA
ncbi:phage tail sheath family protein [Ekhidna sp.]